MKILLYKLNPISLCSRHQRSERRGVEGITLKGGGPPEEWGWVPRGATFIPSQERGGFWKFPT